MSFREEKELIELCKRGDRSAFKQIYETYKDKVHSLAYTMTDDTEAARDITQQTFMKEFVTSCGYE
jgi:RNA polymerase sigma-70 factor (ECF subfamily)